MIGTEQRFHPEYSAAERAYIAMLGVPVVGLRIRARNIENLLPLEITPREILDIGSGPGVITFLLGRHFPDAQVTGVDMLPDAIGSSQQIAERAGITNVSFTEAVATDLPFEDRFDLVTCVDILEHIEDDELALSNIFRAMKPGGSLVLHVPAMYRRYPLFRRQVNFDVPTHVRPGYEPETIVSKVMAVGFDVLNHGFTFGFLETFANNMGYLISGGRKANRHAYAVAFPILNAISWIGRCSRPASLGAGVYVVARKPLRSSTEDRS
jgi:ubiquinone/menaquinone biosynthesis C-methylase UbiE